MNLVFHTPQAQPDAYFYPFVKNVFEDEWQEEFQYDAQWRMDDQALVRYPRPETHALFLSDPYN